MLVVGGGGSVNGRQGIAMLYDQAVTGSAETAGTVFDGAGINWAGYITTCA